MRKIPSLFIRDFEGDPSRVLDEVNPDCRWVLEGEGLPTVKFDGTACMIRDGKLYKRYVAKKGRTPPPEFEPAQERDEKTGHWPGWVPVGDGPEDKWYREGLLHLLGSEGDREYPGDGTYELIGPKVQGNPEHQTTHILVLHGSVVFSEEVPTEFEELRQWFGDKDIEGVVWHHPDGRMAKIKKSDFGLPRETGGGPR